MVRESETEEVRAHY